METHKLAWVCLVLVGCEVGGEPTHAFDSAGGTGSAASSGDATVGTSTSDPDGPETTTGAEPATSAGESDGTSDPTGTTGEPTASQCPGLLAWASSTSFLDAGGYAHPLPAFALGNRFYVHTVINDQRRLRFATFDGAMLGPWSDASADHGGGPHGFTALAADDTAYHFRNGHIAQYVFDEAGVMLGDVVLLEESTDTAFGGELFVWDAALPVVFDSGPAWLLHLGGFSFAPYEYRQSIRRNTLPPGPAFSDTGSTHPGSRPGKSVAFVPEGVDTGFVYTTQTGGPELWRATIDSAGELGVWESLAPMPEGTGNERGDLFTVGRSLFAVRGAAVFRATLANDGTMSPWNPMPSLPTEQVDEHWGDGHTEGPTWGVIDDSVLVTGPDAVFIAPLDHTLDCP